jgi:squalene-hopene/tetraprenyl-beta-curcumene cyclase
MRDPLDTAPQNVTSRARILSTRERGVTRKLNLMRAAMFGACMFAVCFVAGLLVGDTPSPIAGSDPWNAKAAAAYLDYRLAWWMHWPHAARDHETFCVSCHTVVPYAMARPSLRPDLGEQAPSPIERKMLENVTKRVRMWEKVEPFYVGGPKATESRGTESILNALILVRYDAPYGVLNPDTRLAFDHMWAQQLKAGPTKGAWPWLQFQNAPWEGDSQYYGATLAAIAVGTAPPSYRSSSEIQDGMNLLREYLVRGYASQTLIDRLMLLWVSTKLSELLTHEQQNAIIDEALSKQQADGGFSLSSFVGTWQRRDHTPLEIKSDGYATGLVTLVLQEVGVVRDQPQLRRGFAWLMQNQDREGRWLGYSLNKKRNLYSDVGRFMSDAATAYAVLALKHAN